MWPFGSKQKNSAPLYLSNTLSGKKELFTPLSAGRATLYSCGPTVYGRVQIGNLRSFVLADLVARVLQQSGYKVKRVMNITDVGHMVGDGDEGEDKMSFGAKRDSTTPQAIADRYTKLFLEDIRALNVETDKMRFPKASEYVKEDIRMIIALEKKGYTYSTEDGVYFDTNKFPTYGKLVGLSDVKLQAGKRVSIGSKRTPHDFVLWRRAKANDLQQWDSPWGRGNPGWSIECSAMATTLLGKKIDVHTGGEDLASIHHNNEIAQSECANNASPFVRYWIHGAFLTSNGEKLSKSLGNSYTLPELEQEGPYPLALRMLFLQTHYRSPLSFSMESLKAANVALRFLWRVAREKKEFASTPVPDRQKLDQVLLEFMAAVRDDLGTPEALAILFSALRTKGHLSNVPGLSDAAQWKLLETTDKVLGLSLTEPPLLLLNLFDLPPEIQEIAHKREEARRRKDFTASDELRIHLLNRGYHVEDTPSGPLFTTTER